jgi:opacity protein-like surface antigen
MPAFTSTFSLLAIALLLSAPLAHAADNPDAGGPPSGGQNGGSSQGQDRTNKPEEDDFTQTPYTEYGSFNEDKDEEEETKFFQYGRFFGVSLGLGMEFVDGDRGALYDGGFPTFDAKLHYWFDFNWAMDMDFYLAEHYFVGATSTPLSGRYNVSIMHLGLDFKYYFDTKNASSIISFANPYIVIGAGTYTKSTTAAQGQTTGSDTDTQVGFNGGAGVEFALKPRKVYFTLEGKIHIISFNDSGTQDFVSQGIPDLHGNFYTAIGSLLFTW